MNKRLMIIVPISFVFGLICVWGIITFTPVPKYAPSLVRIKQRITHPFPSEDKPIVSGTSYYVAPDGVDTRDGLSPQSALATIQKAVDMAQAGDTIHLLEGVYRQDVRSKRNGTAQSPITITGSSEVIIQGGGTDRVIEINHDYITLEGFTVDGLVGDPKKEKNYRDKLVYLQGSDKRSGVTGVVIKHLTLQNAGGECIRLRYFAQKNEVAYNTIRHCGAYDFKLDGDGKNGEGIYVGTAPEQTDDGKNPTEDRDASNGNWIHHNTIDTQGNECVDMKEGSSGNIVEYNSCTGQRDNDSAGLDSRGNKNIFRYNTVIGSKGAGIRLGGDKKNDGIENDVYGNILQNNEGGGVKILREPQGKICGNSFSENGQDDYTGDKAEEVTIQDDCAS